MNRIFSSLIAVGLLFETGVVQAEVTSPNFHVPHIINYEGWVESGAVNFDGTGQFKFALVNHPASTTYWSNDNTSVAGSEPVTSVSIPVSDGLYSVMLGQTTLTAIPNAAFRHHDVRLRVWFNDGIHGFRHITPDERFVAVPYAMQAGEVQAGAITAASIAPGAVGTSQLASGIHIIGSLHGNATTSTNATQLSAQLSGIGTINQRGNPVDWSQLKNVPASVAGGASGILTWEDVTATHVQAVSGKGYLANNEDHVAITLPASPHLADIVRVNAAGNGAWRLLPNPGQKIVSSATVAPPPSWIARDSRRSWNGVAASADGSKLVATTYAGKIYTSTDYGETWTPRDSERRWGKVTSSADGSRLTAILETTDYIYVSIDSGVTWTARASSKAWKSVASSADGTKLVAGAGSGDLIYTSTDAGVTWAVLPGSPPNSVALTSSADGSKLIAGTSTSTRASTDSGQTWTTLAAAPQNVRALASSKDGSKLVAVVVNGQIYTSADSGTTWTARDSARNWYTVTSSADGSKLAAAVLGGQIYTSTNSGVSWTAVGITATWLGLAISADGKSIVAVPEGGQVYTFNSNWIHRLIAAQDGAIEVQFTGQGRWKILSSSGTFTGH